MKTYASLLLFALSVFGIDVSAQTVSGNIAGHDYVDLGLPSGTKWATCNIGSSNPVLDGKLYAWGEVETKVDFMWSNYKWGSDPNTPKTKYNTKQLTDSDTEEEKIVLEAEDDVASVQWGAQWRMPTKEDFQELIEGCNWVWEPDFKGTSVPGLVGTSKANSNVIFLPAGGYRDNLEIIGVGDLGCYWSSTLMDENSNSAYYLDFSDGSIDWFNHFRYTGRDVRAVVKP